MNNLEQWAIARDEAEKPTVNEEEKGDNEELNESITELVEKDEMKDMAENDVNVHHV